MPTVAEVVRRYGPAYLERFGATLPAAHKKVLRDATWRRTYSEWRSAIIGSSPATMAR